MTEQDQREIDIPGQVREWLKRLLAVSGHERSQAAREISRLGVWSRTGIRTRGSLSASAQNRLPEPDKLGVLVEALQDQDAEVRSQVALALGEWGGAEAARSLAELLRVEQDERVCLFGIAALRTLGGPAALEGLNTALRQGSEAARDAAMEAIEELATGGRKDDSERPPIGEFESEESSPAAAGHASRPGAPRTRGSLGAQPGKPVRTRSFGGPASDPGEKILAALRSIRSNPDEPIHLRDRADELVAYLG
jgi:hypothetical protein